MKKTPEKPIDSSRSKEDIERGKGIRSDFVVTTNKNIAEHCLQLSFSTPGSAEYQYHLDCIEKERNDLKNCSNG